MKIRGQLDEKDLQDLQKKFLALGVLDQTVVKSELNKGAARIVRKQKREANDFKDTGQLQRNIAFFMFWHKSAVEIHSMVEYSAKNEFEYGNLFFFEPLEEGVKEIAKKLDERIKNILK